MLLPGCVTPAPVEETAADPGPSETEAVPLPAEVVAEASPVATAIAENATASGLDPWAEGPLEVEKAYYDFGQMIVTNPLDPNAGLPGGVGVPYNSRLAGSVHYPRDGDGPFPLVLLLHGNHITCEVAVEPGVMWLVAGAVGCPGTPVTEDVPSFEGYDYLAVHLASRGYVVASLDGNDINSRNIANDYGAQERAQLVLRTLDAFAAVNASESDPLGANPLVDALAGRIDLARIGLMGHSRGGEGVGRAVTLNREREDPHRILAVFALAPTRFFHTAPTGVPFATLLPTCDGDVSNLWGAQMYDDIRYLDPADPAPKHQFVVVGASHNFYNTLWTYDDGSRYGDDPTCMPAEGKAHPERGVRTFENQTRNGLVYMAGFFRLYLGRETAFAPFLQGAAAPPAAACPVGVTGCPSLARASHLPGAAQRLVLEDTLDDRAFSGNDVGGTSTLNGFAESTLCTPPDCPGKPTAGGAPQLFLAWEGPASYTLTIPPSDGDFSRYSAFTFRAGVVGDDGRNAAGRPVDLRLVLTDGEGRSASARLSDLSAAVPAATGPLQAESLTSNRVTLDMVRVPLSAFRGVDLTQIRSADLVFDATPKGALQLADVVLQ